MLVVVIEKWGFLPSVLLNYDHDDEHEHEWCEIANALRTIEDLKTKCPRTEDPQP